MVVGAVGGVAMDAAFGQLITAVDALKNTMRESIAFADNAQKASLALGQTFEQTNTSLGGTMENLRGDMNERFAAAIAGLEAGLQGNTAGIARLVNQQRLTGTQSANTAKAFAGMEAALGLSREQTNNLANTLVDTGAQFQVSTDVLVGALDALKATFPAQALAGMGDKVQGAMVQLQAELGPQMAGPLSNVMKMVMDTSMEGYEKLTMLGIGDVRERLSAAQSATEAQEILKDAMVTASNNFKSVAGNAEEGFFQIGIATELFGQTAIDFTTVTNQFGVRIKKENAEADKFAETISTLRTEILQPFAQAMAENVFPIILKVIPMVQDFVIFFVRSLRIGLNLLDPAFKFISSKINEIAKMFEENSASIAKVIHFGIVAPIEGLKLVFGAFKSGLGVLLLGLTKLAEGLARVIAKINNFFGGQLEVNEARIKASQDFAKNMILDGVRIQTEAFDRITMDPAESFKLVQDDLNDPDKLGNRLLADIEEGMRNSFLANAETAKNTKNIDDKTPEIVTTQPKFLDETAAMLGESIERILGVGRDTTAADMLEELRIANEQRGAMAATSPVGTPAQDEA